MHQLPSIRKYYILISLFYHLLIIIDSIKYIENKKYPDFFIIGVQNGGITSARLNLRLHPNISMSENEIDVTNKDIQSKDISNIIKRINSDRTTEFKPSSLLGISSPTCVFESNSIYALYHLFPSAKIIVFIRNPILRIFSDYQMDLENELDKKGKYLMMKSESILRYERMVTDYLQRTTIFDDNQHVSVFNTQIKMGLYAEQFERLSSLYPREQIHIECSEDISETFNYNPIFHFLNIPEMNIKVKHIQPYDKHTLIMNEKSFQLLSQFYKYYIELFLLWLKGYKDTISNITIDVSNHYEGLLRCVKNWNQLNYTTYLRSLH